MSIFSLASPCSSLPRSYYTSMPFSAPAFRSASALARSVITCAYNSLTLPFSFCPSLSDLYSAMDWLSLYCLTCSSSKTFSSSAFLSLPSRVCTLAYSSSLNWWLTELKTSLFLADSMTEIFSLSIWMVSVSVLTSISYFLHRMVSSSSCTQQWLLLAALSSSRMMASFRSNSMESSRRRMRTCSEGLGSTGQFLRSMERSTCMSLEPRGPLGEEGSIVQIIQATTAMFPALNIMRSQQQFFVHPRPKNRILCAYCHMFHYPQDLRHSVCPRMAPHASLLQRENGFACDACEGEGEFERQVKTRMMESKKRYEERLQEWAREGREGARPVQRMIKEEKQVTEVKCEDCRGNGFISRMIPVTRDRNIFLKYEQMAVNPTWQAQRMKSRPAEQAFPCAICLTDCEQGDNYFRMSCSHQFHYHCLLKWLKVNEKCPICRSIDPFIDIKLADKEEDNQSHFLEINQEALVFHRHHEHEWEGEAYSEEDEEW